MQTVIREADRQITPKVWGHECLITNEGGYCGKIMVLNKGFQCSLHFHMKKDEVLFVSKGAVKFELGTEVFVMHSGDSIRVLPGVLHRFAGIEDSEIIEVSTVDDVADSYRRIPSGPFES